MTLKEYFSTGPAMEKPIFDAVFAHLETIGPVHVEPVSVGIFFKNPRKFAQLPVSVVGVDSIPGGRTSSCDSTPVLKLPPEKTWPVWQLVQPTASYACLLS